MQQEMTREEIRAALTGPFGSVRTPFLLDGGIDYDGLRNVIDFNIDGGSNTVLLTAGDSNYLLLDDEEILKVTQVAAEHTAGRAMVVAADRYYWTDRSVEFARQARQMGADGAPTRLGVILYSSDTLRALRRDSSGNPGDGGDEHI